MSLKGMQPLSEVGSQLAFSPSAAIICCARNTQPPAPPAIAARASEGFRPEGRKKLTSEELTQGCPKKGPGFKSTPQGAPIEPTNKGALVPPVSAPWSPAAAATW